MAKIGYEIEGRLRGFKVKTLFIDATELKTSITADWLRKHKVNHVYISDHENIIDLNTNCVITSLIVSGIIVTAEVTEIKTRVRDGVYIFWHAGRATYEQMTTLKHLRAVDQIKLEHERFVMAWSVEHATVTHPDEFEYDVTVELP